MGCSGGIWRNWNTAHKAIQVAKFLSTALCWHLEVSKAELKGLLCHLRLHIFQRLCMIWDISNLTFISFAHSFFSWVCFSLFIWFCCMKLPHHYTFHKESQQKCCKSGPWTINCTAISDLHIRLMVAEMHRTADIRFHMLYSVWLSVGFKAVSVLAQFIRVLFQFWFFLF